MDDVALRFKAYADGACSGNPGPGGWAVIVSQLVNGRYELVGTFGGNELSTTNNRMELKGALTALQIAIRTAVKHAEDALVSFEIVSDSAYVVNAVNERWIEKWAKNGWKGSSGERVKNEDLWRAFARLLSIQNSDVVSFKFTKCKGHSGDIMNEMADSEAVRQRKLASSER